MELTKFISQLPITLEQLSAHLQRAQHTLTRLAKSVASKRRRLREAQCRRENDLRNFLASSLDAIVVTNAERGFVDANPKALDLFGISESNMKQFTIDAFLSYAQVADFDENNLIFKKRQERRGRCTIRRLDGGLRVADFILVPYVVPHVHLFRFLNVAPRTTTLLRFVAKSSTGHTEDAWESIDFHSKRDTS
jgi:PAS domain S-box-containing protein